MDGYALAKFMEAVKRTATSARAAGADPAALHAALAGPGGLDRCERLAATLREVAGMLTVAASEVQRSSDAMTGAVAMAQRAARATEAAASRGRRRGFRP